MKRWLALLLLLAACGGCTMMDEPKSLPSSLGPNPDWLTQPSKGPQSTFFERPFQ
jgi:hypothetical protein